MASSFAPVFVVGPGVKAFYCLAAFAAISFVLGWCFLVSIESPWMNSAITALDCEFRLPTYLEGVEAYSCDDIMPACVLRVLGPGLPPLLVLCDYSIFILFSAIYFNNFSLSLLIVSFFDYLIKQEFRVQKS